MTNCCTIALADEKDRIATYEKMLRVMAKGAR